MAPASTFRTWGIKEICDLVQAKFNKQPCVLQIKIAITLHTGKDVCGCAATDAEKTLSFWIPLLMALEDGHDKMSIVVAPLNLLGKQNIQDLEKAGLSAIPVSKKDATAETFKVSIPIQVFHHDSYLLSGNRGWKI